MQENALMHKIIHFKHSHMNQARLEGEEEMTRKTVQQNKNLSEELKQGLHAQFR